ncbi:MAG: hypothetical protein R6X14_08915 [bacterium]
MSGTVTLLVWLGVMALAAAAMTWLLVGRFPEAFSRRDGRPVRPAVAAVLVLAGMLVLSGLSVLLLTALLAR